MTTEDKYKYKYQGGFIIQIVNVVMIFYNNINMNRRINWFVIIRYIE